MPPPAAGGSPYRTATNMTDMMVGLAALTRMDSPRTRDAFTHFHDRFKTDPW